MIMHLIQRIPRFLLMLLCVLSLGGALPFTVRADTVLRLGGTGCGLGPMKLLALAFQKAHPDISLVVFPSLGSSGGISALFQGELDLALSARALKKDEQGLGARAIAYARTPFVFVANRRVGKRDLGTAELERIYNGTLQEWPDGSRIRLVLRPSGDADTQLVKEISPAMARAATFALTRPGMDLAITDQQSADRVAHTPGALGGITLAELETEQLSVHRFSYNGVAPTLRNLASGSYPLVKKLYLVTGSRSSRQAQQFADFIFSEQGRGILKTTGNLPLGPGRDR